MSTDGLPRQLCGEQSTSVQGEAGGVPLHNLYATSTCSSIGRRLGLGPKWGEQWKVGRQRLS